MLCLVFPTLAPFSVPPRANRSSGSEHQDVLFRAAPDTIVPDFNVAWRFRLCAGGSYW